MILGTTSGVLRLLEEVSRRRLIEGAYRGEGCSTRSRTDG